MGRPRTARPRAWAGPDRRPPGIFCLDGWVGGGELRARPQIYLGQRGTSPTPKEPSEQRRGEAPPPKEPIVCGMRSHHMGAPGVVSDTLQAKRVFTLGKRIADPPGTAHDLQVLTRRRSRHVEVEYFFCVVFLVVNLLMSYIVSVFCCFCV